MISLYACIIGLCYNNNNNNNNTILLYKWNGIFIVLFFTLIYAMEHGSSCISLQWNCISMEMERLILE